MGTHDTFDLAPPLPLTSLLNCLENPVLQDRDWKRFQGHQFSYVFSKAELKSQGRRAASLLSTANDLFLNVLTGKMFRNDSRAKDKPENLTLSVKMVSRSGFEPETY